MSIIQWRCIEHGTNNCRCRKAEAVADLSPRHHNNAETFRNGAIVGTHSVKPARDGEEVDAGKPDKSLGLVGAIRGHAEMIVARNPITDSEVRTNGQARRMLELLDELEEVIVQNQLERSIR